MSSRRCSTRWCRWVVLWTNLHGGIVTGLVLIGLWWAATLTLDPPTARLVWLRRTVVPIGLIGLAHLANPYGMGLPRFLYGAVTMPRPMINEWQSVWVKPLFLSGFLFWFGLCLFGWVFTTLRRRPVEALLCVAAAAQAGLHLRHLTLGTIVCFIFSAGHICAAGRRVWERVRPRLPAVAWLRDSSPPARPLRAVAAGVAVSAMALAAMNVTCWSSTVIHYPIDAIEALRAARFRGDLLTHFNWGNFVLNRMAPSVRVSFDGRFETVFPSRIAAAHWAFYKGDPAGDWLLESFLPDAILLPRGLPPVERLREMVDWENVYEIEHVVIFMPAGRTIPLQPAPTGRDDAPETNLYGLECVQAPLMLEGPYEPALVAGRR